MKQTPILFSTDMVRAILEGRKTQTRRVLKPQPQLAVMEKEAYKALEAFSGTEQEQIGYTWKGTRYIPWPDCIMQFCRYGQIGDVLWVKETFRTGTVWKENMGTDFIEYKADYTNPEGKWKSSLYMPKEHARIWLRITNIRVQRLQDISEEDSISEGIEQEEHVFEMIAFPNERAYHFNPKPRIWQRLDYVKTKTTGVKNFKNTSAKISFQTLWESINGSDSWQENPWVWVVEFERIEKP